MRGNAKKTTLKTKQHCGPVSRGIGRATAAALARAGAHVLVHYGRSAQEAESLVSKIQAKGGPANAISADLRTPNGAALLLVIVQNSDWVLFIGIHPAVIDSSSGSPEAESQYLVRNRSSNYEARLAARLRMVVPNIRLLPPRAARFDRN